MKQFILLSFLYTLSIVSFGQSDHLETDNDSAPELTAADTVHKWSDMDLALTKWQEVKDVFVPKDIKSTTLLLETHTLQQHREYFKNLITKYYLEKEIDTSVAKYPKGMSHFIKEQEKEYQIGTFTIYVGFCMFFLFLHRYRGRDFVSAIRFVSFLAYIFRYVTFSLLLPDLEQLGS